MTRILEGTWEEIKTHDAELTGLRLRVIVEPDEVDYPAGIPAPPNTVRDKAHLEQLLREGLRSPASPLTSSDWDDVRQQFRERLEEINRGPGIEVNEDYWRAKKQRLIEQSQTAPLGEE